MDEILSNSFHEISITLKLKPGKDASKPESYRSIFMMNIDPKVSIKLPN
jgi:hypothetical protein